jgi:ribulose-phosphate 3-epimerase
MDGHFVPTITFGPAMCAALRPHVKTVMDVHLMIAPAAPHIEAFANAGADVITVHAEAETHLDRTLERIRALGKKAGVALNPATSESAIAYVLDKVDLILVMTVNPGFGGQSFLPSQLEKMRRVRDMIGSRPIELEVDGGITSETAPLAVEAGATVLVAGTAVFSGGSANTPDAYGRNIGRLRVACATS